MPRHRVSTAASSVTRARAAPSQDLRSPSRAESVAEAVSISEGFSLVAFEPYRQQLVVRFHGHAGLGRRGPVLVLRNAARNGGKLVKQPSAWWKSFQSN